MKKILLVFLTLLSVRGFSQVDSAQVNLMIDRAISQQFLATDEKSQEIINDYNQIKSTLENYQLQLDSLRDQDQNLKLQNESFFSKLNILSAKLNDQILLVNE